MEIDPTRPNASRIYDYLLGGDHNFPPDQAVAEQLLAAIPELAQGMWLNRVFMHAAAAQLARLNFSCYLDLASGLPTQGYLHEHVPASAKVLYNDIDPATVAYGQQILGDRRHVRYVQSDLRQIETVLATADEFFAGERRVGICLIGVAYFIADEPLRHVLQQLYAWAAPGSQLAISMFDIDRGHAAAQQMLATYERLGTPLYPRTVAHTLDLAAPWQPSGAGLRPLESYAEADLQRTVISDRQRGKMGFGGLLLRT